MKIGIVTYEPRMVKGFDFQIYYVKRANGAVFPAVENMYNDVSCFSDSKAVREKPEIVAVSNEGPATRRNRKLNLPWDYVCPTNEDYRENLLNFIKEVASKNVEGIILNLYHFPEEGFCICPRCIELWRRSGLNWIDWRTKTVTEFIKEASEIAGHPFAVEIWPDPVISKERFGIDFSQLTEYVDFFHVPLSAHDYKTTYWVDMLTRIFVKILKKPVYIELSAEAADASKIDALLKVMAYVSKHNIEGIFLLVYDGENAEKICRYTIENRELHEWFNRHGFAKMVELVEKWKAIY